MVALSTWCRNASMTPGAFVDQALTLGTNALAFDTTLTEDYVRELVREVTARGVAVTAVEAPCPRPRGGRAPRLASPDREERRAAAGATRAALALAAQVGARAVVVRLGALEVEPRDWERLVRGHARRQLGEEQVERRVAERVARSAAALDLARFGLETVLSAAAAAGVTLALANRARWYEVPDDAELGVLLEDFRGAPIAPWLDTAAAHARAALGFAPASAWHAAFGARAAVLEGNFADIRALLARAHISRIDRALFDFGWNRKPVGCDHIKGCRITSGDRHGGLKRFLDILVAQAKIFFSALAVADENLERWTR